MADRTALLTNIKQLIPGTTEYEELHKSKEIAMQVIKRWDDGETVYSQIRDRLASRRDLYLGNNSEQFGSSVEGDLRIVSNMTAAVVDLFVFLISNSPPSLQAIPASTNKVSQVEASIAEALAKRAFTDAKFHRKFRDSAKHLIGFAGFCWWYPFWNEEVKFNKKRGHCDLTLLNPWTTRVFYEDTDFEKISYFITIKRVAPEVVFDMYGIRALSDTENPFLPREIWGDGISDNKVTVFKQYDKKYVTTVVDNMVAEEPYEHGLDFTPLIQTNNIKVLNDAHGQDDVYRMLPVAQELNALISAASEIARDLAYPPILEYNTALGGRKVTKWRGNKIQVRRTDKGEAIEYLTNKAQIGPLLEQIRLLTDIFHFVSLMPKAAAGIFDSTVTSGFQARIAMQPATLAGENKKIDIEESIKELAKIFLYFIEKNSPEALKIDENTRIVNLHELDFDIIWPDNLPIDIAREIQNLVIGIQSNVTSVTQAIDKYNVLMGMGSTEDTLDYLRQESEEPDLNPDRALKLAQVKQLLAQVDQAARQISQSLNPEALPPEQRPEAQGSNLNNAMLENNPVPEEQNVPPATAREAVTPESTGGVVLPPEGGSE